MKKQLVFLLFFLFSGSLSLRGQNYLWTSILSKNHYSQIEDAPNGLFLVSDGSLFFVDRNNLSGSNGTFTEVASQLIDRKYGLSDSHIAAIRYSVATSSLVVYYQTGNIDIITAEGEVKNVPAIYENLRLTDKTITQIVPNKNRVYLVGGFGISKMDLQGGGIEATYFLGKKVLSAFFRDEKIYALMPENTLCLGDETNNLQDPSNWKKMRLPLSDADIVSCAINGDELLVLGNKGQLFALSIQGLEEGSTAPHLVAEQVTGLFSAQKGVYFVSDKQIFQRNEELKNTLLTTDTNPIYSAASNLSADKVWYNTAYSFVGLSLAQQSATVEHNLQLDKNAPWDNNYYYSLFSQGRFYAVGGGRSSDRHWLPGTIKIYDNEKWINITPREVTPVSNSYFNDIVSIAVDPADKNHFFVSSWGEGLFEFHNDTYTAHYSQHNTPELVSALPDSKDKEHFVRVSSLAFDRKSGGLWMAQGSVRENILYRSKEGTWHKYYHPSLTDVNSFGTIHPMSNGDIWVTIARRGDAQKGILVLNNGGTLDNQSDDKMLYIPQFVDRSGKNIATQTIFTAVQDHNGALWLGTDKGPLVVANPLSILRNTNNAPLASRPVGGKEPNLYYVLDNIPIVALAVDNINNKWMGTENDGLYLLSADGTTILEHFTTSNSPLLSNHIKTLSLDANTGLLYISTPVGLMTYQTGNRGMSKEEMKSEIHVYPNPLRPEDTDIVTITGLTVGMEVKVTDSYGNLLHSSTAVGSEVSFPARRTSGERFASGVYVVMVYDPQSSNSQIVRFAVIE